MNGVITANFFLDIQWVVVYFLLQSIRLETAGPRGQSIQPAIAKVDT